MNNHRLQKNSEQGFSLIETMIAVLVLAIGLAGGAAVISVALATNGRSRFDTMGTGLAESVMERIVAIPFNTAGTTNLTDCTLTTNTINTAVGGAALTASKTIDFTAAKVTGYQMDYVECSAGNTNVYDVRWHIEAGPTPNTHYVVVGAKNKGQIGNTGSSGQQLIFAPPANLRSLRGDF